jgi:uncharacterized SAM-binding protein YcdF (DUF218 family)
MNKRPTKTAAIVLGGGLEKVTLAGESRYEPTTQAKARLDRAYALFMDGHVDTIISTGKYGPMAEIDPTVTGPRTEAEVGGAYLITKFATERGEAIRAGCRIEDHIIYEDQSMDTIGNAWFAKKLCLEPLDITSCIIVTSDYHIERSRVIFEWVLGPRYTVGCAEAPSRLSRPERERRDRFETFLIDFVKAHLVNAISPGNDEAIAQFMETEHQALLRGGGPPPSGLWPDEFDEGTSQ